MNDPIPRDVQLELMATVDQRHAAYIERWLNDPRVLELLSQRPEPMLPVPPWATPLTAESLAASIARVTKAQEDAAQLPAKP